MRTVRGEDGSMTIELDDPSSKDSSKVLTRLIKATLPGGASLRLRDVKTGRTYSQHTNGYTEAPDPTSRPAYDPDCPCKWRFLESTKTCPFTYGYEDESDDVDSDDGSNDDDCSLHARKKAKRVIPAFVEHAYVEFWFDINARRHLCYGNESREVMELLAEVEAYTQEHPKNWRKLRVHFGRVSGERENQRVSFDNGGFDDNGGFEFDAGWAGWADDHRGTNHFALRSWTVVDKDVNCCGSGCSNLPEVEPRTVLFVSILKRVIMAKNNTVDLWYELFCEMTYKAGRLYCDFDYGS